MSYGHFPRGDACGKKRSSSCTGEGSRTPHDTSETSSIRVASIGSKILLPKSLYTPNWKLAEAEVSSESCVLGFCGGEKYSS
ncbi:hypothetical protein PM082_022976 [Marasmius tenuissimus]|nr:hypothetical protein PM082_022976 [Marasmius tenuissimus]